MPSVGSAYVTIRVNTKGFEADLNRSMARLSKQMEKHGRDLGKSFNKGLESTKPDNFFKRVGIAADKASTQVKNASDRMARSLDAVGERSIDVGDVIQDVFSDVSRAAGEMSGDVRNASSSFTEMKNSTKGISAALNDIGNGGSNVGRGLASGGGGAGFFARQLDQIAAAGPGMRRLLDHLYNTASFNGTALVGVAGAASAAGQGIFIMASNAAAAAPALSVLANAAIAFAQVGAVIGTASKGVGEAISAGFDKATEATKGVSGATAAMTSSLNAASRAVRNAKQNLEEAYQDAARAAEDAADRVQDAERDVANAQREVLQAQRLLNAARKEGLEQLEDIAFAAEDASLAEERAALNLEDAYAKLQAVQSLPPDDKGRREAELAFKEADLQLREARDRREDADRAQQDAAKNGLKGTAAMQDAYSNLNNAQETAVEAQERLNEARQAEARTAQDNARRISEAQEAVADATARMAEAQGRAADSMTALGKATSAYDEAMRKLSPSQKEFVELIVASGDRFAKARKKIAEPLFDGLVDGLSDILNKGLFDKIIVGLTGTSSVLGKLAKSAGAATANDLFQGKVAKVMESNNRALESFGKAGGSLLEILLNLAVAAGPLAEEFGKYTEELFGGIAATQRADEDLSGLSKTVQTAGERFKEWFSFMGALKDVVVTLGSAANDAANNFGELETSANGEAKPKGYIPTLTESLQKFNDGLKDNPQLVQDFTNGLENFNALGRALKTVTEPLIDLGQDPKIGIALDIIANSDAFQRLGDTAADALPELAELAEHVLNIVAALSESGSIQAFLDKLGDVAGAINDIVNSKLGSAFIGFVGPILGVIAAFRLLRKGLFGVFGAFFGDLRRLPGHVAKAGSSIAAGGKGFRASGTRIGNSFLLGFKSGLGGIAGEVKIVAKKAGTSLKTAFSSENTKLRNAGQKSGLSFTEGFALGIKEGQVAIVTAARTAGVAAGKAINSALGIKSPSTVGIRTGNNLMAGVSIGIKQGSAAANLAAASAGASAGAAVGKGASAGATASLGKSGGPFTKMFGGLGKAAGPTSKLMKPLSLGVRGLGAAFRFAMGPLFTIILVFELLLPLFKKLYKENETFRNIVDKAWAGLKVAFEAVSKVLGDVFAKFSAFISEHMPAIKAVFADVMGFIGAIIQNVLIPVFNNVLMPVIRAFVGFVQTAIPVVQKVFSFLFEAIKFYIVNIFIPYWTLIFKIIQKLFEVAKPIFIKTFELISSAFNKIRDVWNNVLKPALGAVRDAFQAVRNKVGDVVDGVKNKWDDFKNGLESLRSTVSDKVQKIKDIFGTIKDAVASAFGGLVGAVGKPLQLFIDFINDNFIANLNKLTSPFGLDIGDIPDIPGQADGGPVKGRGGPRQDNQLRRLSVGEYVVKTSSARKIGPRDMAYINKYGRLPSSGGFDITPGFDMPDIPGADKLKNLAKDTIGGIKNVGEEIAKKGIGPVLSKLVGALQDSMSALGIRKSSKSFIPKMLWGIMEEFEKQMSKWGGEKYKQATGSLEEGTWSHPLPFRAPITQYPNRGHSPNWAVDFGVASGTSVRSVSSGRVVTSRDLGNNSYGKYVEVEHANGIRSLYAHLSVIAVKLGRMVSGGQTLGYSGSTGRSTGPHLHFEIKPGADTLDELRKRGVKFASGGVASARTGGLLSFIAEAGRDERVEPLDNEGFSKRDRKILELIEALVKNGGQGDQYIVQPSPGMDERELAEMVIRKVRFNKARAL